jgi:hypothetical protein
MMKQASGGRTPTQALRRAGYSNWTYARRTTFGVFAAYAGPPEHYYYQQLIL